MMTFGEILWSLFSSCFTSFKIERNIYVYVFQNMVVIFHCFRLFGEFLKFAVPSIEILLMQTTWALNPRVDIMSHPEQSQINITFFTLSLFCCVLFPTNNEQFKMESWSCCIVWGSHLCLFVDSAVLVWHFHAYGSGQWYHNLILCNCKTLSTSYCVKYWISDS